MLSVALAGSALYAKLAPKLVELYGEVVAGNDHDIRRNLNESRIRGGVNATHFLPMPPLPSNSKLCTAFFRPSFFGDQGSECDIEVAVIGPGIERSFGLRFERGRDGDDDTHGYCHVQMTKDFDRRPVKFLTRLPPQMTESYPAMPTRARCAGDAWIAVLISLFGHAKSPKAGLRRVIDSERLRDRHTRVPDAFDRLLARADHIHH